MDSVDRIEVVKGVASSLYGSQAMGGVINIITKNPVKGERSASVAYGSYGTWIKRLNIGDKVGKFGMRVSYEGRKTNGYENNFVNASVTSKKQKGAVPVSEITGLQKTKNNLGINDNVGIRGWAQIMTEIAAQTRSLIYALA